MKLYLMRHAQAEYGEQMDPTRKLTPTGKKQARMMGKWLNRQTDKPDLVLESNFHRSHATAKRIAKRIDAPVVRTGKLDPDSSPESAWREIRKQAALAKVQNVIAVTHGPLVEKITAMLIGAPSFSQIHFAHGAVAHFDTVRPITEAKGEYVYDEVEQKRLILGSGGASGVNCEFCEEAADRGWIDMDDVFEGPDGDVDESPLHPNCDCTVEQATRRVRVYESGRREAMYEDGPGAFFHWMVTPNTVARDEDEQDLVTEAALQLAAAAIESMPEDPVLSE
jgi:phosphohistidine phosphatase